MELHKNKNWLRNKYYKEQLSLKQMSEICNVCISTIQNWMERFNLKRRTYIIASRMGLVNVRGEKNSQWKGGRINVGGYIYIYMPDHPSVEKYKPIRGTGRHIPEHRLMAEKALGRLLKKREIVHHVNGIKHDNRNDNFVICTNSYHRWLENKMADLYKQEHFHKPPM